MAQSRVSVMMIAVMMLFVRFKLIKAVVSSSQCPPDFIRRWNREDHTLVCCKPIHTCPPGSYVEKCTVNYGKDKCRLCPKGTRQWDETNSTNIGRCEEYSCPRGAKMVGFISERGCGRPCMCDTDKGYYGNDPCNCQIIPDECKPWEKNGKKCLSHKNRNSGDAEFRPPDPARAIDKDFHPENDAASSDKEEEVVEKNGEPLSTLDVTVESTTTPNVSIYEVADESGLTIVPTVLVALALLLISVVPIIWLIRKRKKRKEMKQTSVKEASSLTGNNFRGDPDTSLNMLEMEEVEIGSDTSHRLLETNGRPVGMAACFRSVDRDVTTVPEPVTDPAPNGTNVIAPSGSRL